MATTLPFTPILSGPSTGLHASCDLKPGTSDPEQSQGQKGPKGSLGLSLITERLRFHRNWPRPHGKASLLAPGQCPLPSACQITHDAGLGYRAVILNPTKGRNMNSNIIFIVSGVEWCPPRSIYWRPLCNSECDLIQKQGFYRYNQVKMRSLGWAPIQYHWCPYKKREFGQSQARREGEVKRHKLRREAAKRSSHHSPHRDQP